MYFYDLNQCTYSVLMSSLMWLNPNWHTLLSLLTAGLRLLAERHVPEQQSGAAGQLQSCHGVPAAELQGSHRLSEVRDTAQPTPGRSRDSKLQARERHVRVARRGEASEISISFDYCNQT